MSTTQGPNPIDPLASAIADRVWAFLQEKLSERENIQLISIPAAAKRLSICDTKFRNMIAAGEIPPKVIRKIGRRVLIVSGELERWASAQ